MYIACIYILIEFLKHGNAINYSKYFTFLRITLDCLCHRIIKQYLRSCLPGLLVHLLFSRLTGCLLHHNRFKLNARHIRTANGYQLVLDGTREVHLYCLVYINYAIIYEQM